MEISINEQREIVKKRFSTFMDSLQTRWAFRERKDIDLQKKHKINVKEAQRKFELSLKEYKGSIKQACKDAK